MQCQLGSRKLSSELKRVGNAMNYREITVGVATTDPMNPLPEIVFASVTGGALGYIVSLFLAPEKRTKATFLGAFGGLIVAALSWKN